jgi:hypothetical protein
MKKQTSKKGTPKTAKKDDLDQTELLVLTGESGTRGWLAKKLKVEDLSLHVNRFLEQMNGILEKTPQKLGKFEFAEFEIHAEITGKGTLALLGSGGEAGATGGIKFLFRRVQDSEIKGI